MEHFAEVPGLEEVEYGTERHGRLGGYKVVQADPAAAPAPGEKIASEQMAGPDQNVGLAHDFAGARVPGDVRPYEEPVDAASDSELMPEQEPADLGAAEQAADDPRHILRGTSHMASSKGSS